MTHRIVAVTFGCGDTTYQCEIYNGSTRFATDWFDAASVDEAEEICEDKNAPYDCQCTEDN